MVLYSDTFQMGNWSHIHIIWDYFHQARSYLEITGFILPDSYMYIFITANWTQIWKSRAPYTKEKSLKVLNCLSETVSRHYKHVPKKAKSFSRCTLITKQFASDNLSWPQTMCHLIILLSVQDRTGALFALNAFPPLGKLLNTEL